MLLIDLSVILNKPRVLATGRGKSQCVSYSWRSLFDATTNKLLFSLGNDWYAVDTTSSSSHAAHLATVSETVVYVAVAPGGVVIVTRDNAAVFYSYA